MDRNPPGTRKAQEVAQSLGVSSAEVLRQLQKIGQPVVSANAEVPVEAEAAIRTRIKPAEQGQRDVADGLQFELETLIRQAFAAARTTKGENWRTMTVPVLKNRLLQLTGRSFDEKKYGARTIGELVHSLEHLLDVDVSARPSTIRLKGHDEVVTSATATGLSSRVRRDLWNAVMDFSAGHRWVWSDGAAVPETEGVSGAQMLPTLTANELGAWRAEFAAKQADPAGLQEWVSSSGATRQLPAAFRPLWNAELKAKVLTRLQGWFTANALETPEDAVGSATAKLAAGPGHAARPGSLRAFVAGCVAVMTERELEALVLPASAVHRYAERRP